MSHAYRDPGGVPDYLVETWFNPPATQALAMPGWFDRHFENMRRYRHMACAGVLVGTTTPGRVKPSRDEPQIEYTPADCDRRPPRRQGSRWPAASGWRPARSA